MSIRALEWAWISCAKNRGEGRKCWGLSDGQVARVGSGSSCRSLSGDACHLALARHPSALAPLTHADLDLVAGDVDDVVRVGLAAEPIGDDGARLADEDGGIGGSAGAGRDAVSNGVPVVAAHEAQMEMAREHEPHAEPRHGLEREAGPPHLLRGLKGLAERAHQRMMRDDDAERRGARGRKAFPERAQLRRIDRTMRPIAIGERTAGSIEPGERERGTVRIEFEEGLDLGRDIAAIKAIGIEKSAHRIAAEIVIAGDGKNGDAQPDEELVGHLKLGGCAALGEIARGDDEIGLLCEQVCPERGRNHGVVVAEMQVGDVGESHYRDSTRGIGWGFRLLLPGGEAAGARHEGAEIELQQLRVRGGDRNPIPRAVEREAQGLEPGETREGIEPGTGDRRAAGIEALEHGRRELASAETVIRRAAGEPGFGETRVDSATMVSGLVRADLAGGLIDSEMRTAIEREPKTA